MTEPNFSAPDQPSPFAIDKIGSPCQMRSSEMTFLAIRIFAEIASNIGGTTLCADRGESFLGIVGTGIGAYFTPHSRWHTDDRRSRISCKSNQIKRQNRIPGVISFPSLTPPCVSVEHGGSDQTRGEPRIGNRPRPVPSTHMPPIDPSLVHASQSGVFGWDVWHAVRMLSFSQPSFTRPVALPRLALDRSLFHVMVFLQGDRAPRVCTPFASCPCRAHTRCRGAG